MPPTTPVHVRIENEPLSQLEEIGRQIAPKPLNRSEMINVAIKEYVRQHAASPKRRTHQATAGGK